LDATDAPDDERRPLIRYDDDDDERDMSSMAVRSSVEAMV
jgi:hypothetical protein